MLDSRGGLFQEAVMLAKSISERGLDTFVAGECSSACTLVFLAGKRRCSAESARIGFHAGSIAHDLSRKTFREIADYQRNLYLKAGVAAPFVDEMMQTPSRSAWYPSSGELLAAGVTTPGCP
jgi:hypothetical protein